MSNVRLEQILGMPAPQYAKAPSATRDGTIGGAIFDSLMLDTSVGQYLVAKRMAARHNISLDSMQRRVLPGYDPRNDNLDGYERWLEEFANSTSPEETLMIKQTIDFNSDLRLALEDYAGWRFAASLLDPVNLIPVPFAIGKGFGKGLMTALKAGTPVVAGTELLRHHYDPTSTTEETLFNVVGGTLFMGLWGGAVGKIPKSHMTVSELLSRMTPPPGQTSMFGGIPFFLGSPKQALKRVNARLKDGVAHGDFLSVTVNPKRIKIRVGINESSPPEDLAHWLDKDVERMDDLIHIDIDDAKSVISAKIEGDVVTIHDVAMPDNMKRKGLDTAAVKTLIKWAEDHGKLLRSSIELSPDAARVMDDLIEEGFNIKKNPNVEETPDGGLRSTDGKAVFDVEPIIDPLQAKVTPEIRERLEDFKQAANRADQVQRDLDAYIELLKKKVNDAPTAGGAKTKAEKALKQALTDKHQSMWMARLARKQYHDLNVTVSQLLDEQTVKDWDLLPTGYNWLLGKIDEFPFWVLLRTDLREMAPDLAVRYQMFALKMGSTPGLNNKGNRLGSTTGPSIEALIFEYRGKWVSANMEAMRIYRKYAGYGESTGMMKQFVIDQSQRVRSSTNQILGGSPIKTTADGKLTIQEFNKQISIAMTQEGKHDIPEVMEAAAAWRKVLDEIGEEGKLQVVFQTQLNLQKRLNRVQIDLNAFNEKWKTKYKFEIEPTTGGTRLVKGLDDDIPIDPRPPIRSEIGQAEIAREKTAASVKADEELGHPLNPKVADAVHALNDAGIETSMSGDLYAGDLVYIDVVIPLDSINHDLLPAGWVADLPLASRTEAHFSKRFDMDEEEKAHLMSDDFVEQSKLDIAEKMKQQGLPMEGRSKLERSTDGSITRLAKEGETITKSEIEKLIIAIKSTSKSPIRAEQTPRTPEELEQEYLDRLEGYPASEWEPPAGQEEGKLSDGDVFNPEEAQEALNAMHALMQIPGDIETGIIVRSRNDIADALWEYNAWRDWQSSQDLIDNKPAVIEFFNNYLSNKPLVPIRPDQVISEESEKLFQLQLSTMREVEAIIDIMNRMPGVVFKRELRLFVNEGNASVRDAFQQTEDDLKNKVGMFWGGGEGVAPDMWVMSGRGFGTVKTFVHENGHLIMDELMTPDELIRAREIFDNIEGLSRHADFLKQYPRDADTQFQEWWAESIVSYYRSKGEFLGDKPKIKGFSKKLRDLLDRILRRINDFFNNEKRTVDAFIEGLEARLLQDTSTAPGVRRPENRAATREPGSNWKKDPADRDFVKEAEALGIPNPEEYVALTRRVMDAEKDEPDKVLDPVTGRMLTASELFDQIIKEGEDGIGPAKGPHDLMGPGSEFSARRYTAEENADFARWYEQTVKYMSDPAMIAKFGGDDQLLIGYFHELTASIGGKDLSYARKKSSQRAEIGNGLPELPSSLEQVRLLLTDEIESLKERLVQYSEKDNINYMHRIWITDAVKEGEVELKEMLFKEFTENPKWKHYEPGYGPDDQGEVGTDRVVIPEHPDVVMGRVNETYASILRDAETGGNSEYAPKGHADTLDWLHARQRAVVDDVALPERTRKTQIDIINKKIQRIEQGIGGSGGSGPLLARRLELNDTQLINSGFIESDVNNWMEHYVSRTAPIIETARMFGDPKADGYINKLFDDTWMQSLDLMITDPKKAEAMQKEAVRLRTAMQDLRDIVHGTWALPDNPDAITPRILRILRNFNVLGAMGRSVLMAFGDIGNVIISQGFARSLSYAVENYASGISDGGIFLIRKEVELAGAVSEVVLGMRYAAMTDFGKAVGSSIKHPRLSAFEQGLSDASKRFFLYNLLGPWTDMAKKFSGGMLQSRLIENSVLWRDGRLSKSEITIMGRLGINRAQAEQFADEWESSEGLMHKSMYIANTGEWASKSAVRAFRAAMNTEINRMIPTPGAVDKPKTLLKSEWWKMIGQYRGFSIAATHRIMGAGLHSGAAARFSGAVSMLAIAMIVDSSKRPDYMQMPIEEQIFRAVELSGITGIFLDLNDTIERITAGAVGIRPMFGMDIRERNPNWSNRMGTLGAVPNQWLTLMYGLTSDNAETDDVARAIRYMIPYNNLIWWNEAFNRGQRAAVDFIEEGDK